MRRVLMRREHFPAPFFFHNAAHTVPMDELETLRALVGPDAANWTPVQLQQMQAEIERVAALLLDLYRAGQSHHDETACGLRKIDVRQTDR